MAKQKYFLGNVNDFISYLITKFDNPTDVKIEKSLYFFVGFLRSYFW